jgi:hypothetical protein
MVKAARPTVKPRGGECYKMGLPQSRSCGPEFAGTEAENFASSTKMPTVERTPVELQANDRRSFRRGIVVAAIASGIVWLAIALLGWMFWPR